MKSPYDFLALIVMYNQDNRAFAMKVMEFDIEKGLYVSQVNSIETEIHSHPAIEVIFAEKGNFTLETKNAKHSDLTFAVIDANIKHKVNGKGCLLNIVMIEHRGTLIREVLAKFEIQVRDGLYLGINTVNCRAILTTIINRVSSFNGNSDYDDRVSKTISYINNHHLDYQEMIKTLTQIVHLSESRISHLFKENVGVSLKKYLVWCKLKTTIKHHLNKDEDLLTSLIQSGFYDQPHFSKAYKSMLGINSSKVYNSGMLQIPSDLRT